MTLEDLLKPETEREPRAKELYTTRVESVHYLEFFKFIQTNGIDNIRSKDMNKLIERYGPGVLNINGFTDYYNIISSNESNKVMRNWTIAIGLMTVVVMIATVIMLFTA